MITFDGVIEMSNALGGVDVCVAQPHPRHRHGPRPHRRHPLAAGHGRARVPPHAPRRGRRQRPRPHQLAAGLPVVDDAQDHLRRHPQQPHRRSTSWPRPRVSNMTLSTSLSSPDTLVALGPVAERTSPPPTSSSSSTPSSTTPTSTDASCRPRPTPPCSRPPCSPIRSSPSATTAVGRGSRGRRGATRRCLRSSTTPAVPDPSGDGRTRGAGTDHDDAAVDDHGPDGGRVDLLGAVVVLLSRPAPPRPRRPGRAAP